MPRRCEMREALAAGDIRAEYAANSRLHDEITQLSGNALQAGTLEPLVGRVGLLRHKVEDFNLTHAEHEAMCEAISTGQTTPDQAAAGGT